MEDCLSVTFCDSVFHPLRSFSLFVVCLLGSDGSCSTLFNACEIFKSAFCVSSPTASVMVVVKSGFVRIEIIYNAACLSKSSALTWGNGTTTCIKVRYHSYFGPCKWYINVDTSVTVKRRTHVPPVVSVRCPYWFLRGFSV